LAMYYEAIVIDTSIPFNIIEVHTPIYGDM
ncbi:unnamed protein product, partial [marine sediment metagenome]